MKQTTLPFFQKSITFESRPLTTNIMGIELELGILLLVQLIGTSTFAAFAIETPAWQKIIKWIVLDAIILSLTIWLQHWALLILLILLVPMMIFHFTWCKKNGIHPIKGTPRKKYYELRKWKWQE